MFARLSLLFPLLICLLGLSRLHAEFVYNYDQMRVCRIDIIPENLPIGTSFDTALVRGRLRTKAGNYFSQAEFDADLKMLADEYDRVEPAFQVIGGELYITVRLFCKPMIRSLLFCGNERISAKKLCKQLGLSEGALFERNEFIQGFNKIKMYYVRKGYFESQLDFEVLPVPGTNEVDIRINVCEGRAGRIGNIKFCGLDPCEESELLELMVTKRHNFLLSWYTGRGTYHPDMIEHDQMTILSYLQDQGYADALVQIYTEECASPDKISLVIAVDKGVRYFIGNMTLQGNTLFSDQEIWDQFQFGCGSIYSPEKLRSTIKAIRDLYGSCGYIDAYIDLQLTLSDCAPVYDISVHIDEGCQTYVGMIRVFGNLCTRTKVVLNESLLYPGEVFDNRRLEGTEKRLLNTGYFSNVNVYAVKQPYEGSNHRDVYIEVQEADTGNVGLFFGFSSLDRLFGGVELTERNFNIAGIPQVFKRGPGALRGGGEYAHLKANIGDKQTSYIAQWTKPYFLDTPWIVGFDLEKNNNRVFSSSYEIRTYGGSAHATYIWNDFLKYDLYYRARYNTVSGSQTVDALFIAGGGDQKGLVSAIGATAIYDSTDSPRRPTCGLRSRLLYELAGLGGRFQFMKFSYTNSYYYPMTRKGTLKFRADLQFIYTYGGTTPTDLPLGERFFLGGETTVRGYRPFIIGPKFGNNEPAGGVSSYLLSEEYSHNLLDAPCLDAFVFVDAGYVSLSEFTIGRQAAAVGFGIRLEVMRNVPITLGLGWPIHPSETLNGRRINNARRFFFSMGGNF